MKNLPNRDELNHYLGDYIALLHNIKATDRDGKDLTLPVGIDLALSYLLDLKKQDKILRFIGNGGSAGIAMHQNTDFFRTAEILTDSLFDPIFITCMANDMGYDNVFSAPLKIKGKQNDMLVAISSSGKSLNILQACDAAKEKKGTVITLSGFNEDNELRKKGDINFYVSSNSYRLVESVHLFLCNWLLDFLIKDEKWNHDALYQYLGEYLHTLHKIMVNDGSGKQLNLMEAVCGAIDIINKRPEGGVMRFIGNGGSAGIAMHQHTDFFRTAGIATDSLFDSTLLTCMANDVGYENIFSVPLATVAKKGDILVALSVTGMAQNVLRACDTAREKECSIITFSAPPLFDEESELKKKGDINFYVPSKMYRFAENIHLFICNWILDFMVRQNEK